MLFPIPARIISASIAPPFLSTLLDPAFIAFNAKLTSRPTFRLIGFSGIAFFTNQGAMATLARPP